MVLLSHQPWSARGFPSDMESTCRTAAKKKKKKKKTLRKKKRTK